jgi:hypothetical protein
MAGKTWLPALRELLRATCNYINKWRVILDDQLTAPQRELLTDVVTACNAMVAVLDTLIPPPN